MRYSGDAWHTEVEQSKGSGSKLQSHEEGQSTQQPKRCDYANEDNSPNDTSRADSVSILRTEPSSKIKEKQIFFFLSWSKEDLQMLIYNKYSQRNV